MTSGERPPAANSTRNVSVESFPYAVDDRYYLRRMKEILQDGLPKPTPPLQHDQVSGHVYIGNQRNADDTSGLRSDGIDHVLSCAASRRSTESPYDGDSGIVDYFLIPAEDREDFDITRFFDAAFLFLDRVKRRRGKVLVHCNMGVNRSGAVVAAYLMVDEKKKLLEVVSYLKVKRRLVLSNKGFRLQLIQFARSRGLLDPVVDTVTRISYMDERRRAFSEENCEKAEKSKDKASFRQLMRDLEHELINGNEVIEREGRAGKVIGRRKEKGEIQSRISRESSDDVVLNGSFDAASLSRTINDSRISTASTKTAISDLETSPRKYSSSVQYWPKIESPHKANIAARGGSTTSAARDEQQSGATTAEQKPVVTKKRRYVRTRSDYQTGANADAEKLVTSNAEPHKLLSTIFCTLRPKPKRNIEIVKQNDIVDGAQRLRISNHDASGYHSHDATSKSSLESPSFADGTSVNFRPRCLSGTAVDRPSSYVCPLTNAGVSRSAAEREDSNGFLVLLGKKVVHAKSSSQWNLSVLDRETEPFYSTESARTGGGIFAGPRRHLHQLSVVGSPWRSVERISESKNVFLIRKNFF